MKICVTHNSQCNCHTQAKYYILSPWMQCWCSYIASETPFSICRALLTLWITHYLYPDVVPSFQHVSSLMSSLINPKTVRNFLVFDFLLTINDAQLYSKFSLMRHTKAVNALWISPERILLLNGGDSYVFCFVHNSFVWLGNNSQVVVWNLASGKIIQELCVPLASFMSCLTWIKLLNGGENMFRFGASDENIHLYKCCKNALFCFFII